MSDVIKPPVKPEPKPPEILPRPPRSSKTPSFVRKVTVLHLAERRDETVDELLNIVEHFHYYYPVESPVNPELSEAWDNADKLLAEIKEVQDRRETASKISKPAPPSTPTPKS